MTLFKRCDSCSADISRAPDPDHWIDIVVYYIGAADPPVNFCSWRCLREYAVARSLIDWDAP